MTNATHSPSIVLVRTVGFSSAHRYFDRRFSEAENREIYGTLYRDDGFGHNFLLEAYFTGPIDPLTGMIVNLSQLDHWLKCVSLRLDHFHLNDLEIFAGLAPTPERIAQFCFTEINTQVAREAPKDVRLLRVRLHEGEHLWVDVDADTDVN